MTIIIMCVQCAQYRKKSLTYIWIFSDGSRARKLMNFEQTGNRENPILLLNIILLLSISEHRLLRPRKDGVGVTS